MINEKALLESQALRSGVLDRTDVLDRVKALSLLPDGMHVTTAMVAAYFNVTVEAIRALVQDHRDELEASEYRVLTGTELSDFKQLSGIQSRTRSLALFPRRAVLNVAMLLRDSEVARQVRIYLLDMEYLARTQPVENPGHTERDTGRKRQGHPQGHDLAGLRASRRRPAAPGRMHGRRRTTGPQRPRHRHHRAHGRRP
ncbi:hypothetical protein [Streptomyces sp. NRRL S-481]|uniref:hypothetical protein n=1 Tax=Streptomyces sp. NRRL S-481 TaxID=1463911 RepID=UPI000A90BB0B|nr:hypothetical protein [Streptomyces sp. NRRL S-481]